MKQMNECEKLLNQIDDVIAMVQYDINSIKLLLASNILKKTNPRYIQLELDWHDCELLKSKLIWYKAYVKNQFDNLEKKEK